VHAVPRRIGAALIGALVVAALALTMTARADAATTTVEIVSKATINEFVNPVMDPRGDHTITNPSSGDLKWFIKTDVGNAATYKSYRNPSKCLTAPQSSSHITMEPCNFGTNQLWSQGFQSGQFREFHNLGTGRSATAEGLKSHNGTFCAEVVQSFFFGNANQLWQVRPV
jgi:hypothetical protein